MKRVVINDPKELPEGQRLHKGPGARWHYHPKDTPVNSAKEEPKAVQQARPPEEPKPAPVKVRRATLGKTEREAATHRVPPEHIA